MESEAAQLQTVLRNIPSPMTGTDSTD